MACVNLMKINNPYFGSPFSPIQYRQQRFFEVPCGWCLNCRVDKRNFLEDCCNFHQAKYGYCAFVTFTYDDNWLLNNCNPFHSPVSCISFKALEWLKKRRKQLNLVAKRKQGLFSLNKDDVKKLNYRLRFAVKQHPDCPSNNHSYKVLYVGEYGGRFQRPHIHALFFGLDYTSPLFTECWKFGMVKSLPIKNGAFRYVIDYLDKQVHGSLVKELYDDCGLERPFMCHSVGFGSEFILSKLDDIKKNNGSYEISPYKMRPVPMYYRKKMQIKVDPEINKQKLLDKYKRQYNYIYKNDDDFDRYKKDMSLIRYKHLREQCRQKQQAVDDNLIPIMFGRCSDIEIRNILNEIEFDSLVPKDKPIDLENDIGLIPCDENVLTNFQSGGYYPMWQCLIYSSEYKDIIPF